MILLLVVTIAIWLAVAIMLFMDKTETDNEFGDGA